MSRRILLLGLQFVLIFQDEKSFGTFAQYANTTRLWVSHVTNYSTQYDASNWPASQVVGPPDVYPKYGDIVGTWAQAKSSLDANQFIQVAFQEKLFVHEINIYETYNAGGVKEIQAKESDAQWVTIWSTPQVKVISRSRIFTPDIQELDFATDELRIFVDCSVSRSYVEIDAVEILGIPNNQIDLPREPSESAHFDFSYDPVHLTQPESASVHTPVGIRSLELRLLSAIGIAARTTLTNETLSAMSKMMSHTCRDATDLYLIDI